MNLKLKKDKMAYTCKICKFHHSCWCWGKKCRCGMNLWEARTAERLVTTYNIEDTQKLIELIKQKNSEQSILAKLNIDSTQDIVAKYTETQTTTKNIATILDSKFARTIWMKWVYCEYNSFNDEAECIFCWRKRKDWYRMPCLYYLAKLQEQWPAANNA